MEPQGSFSLTARIMLALGVALFLFCAYELGVIASPRPAPHTVVVVTQGMNAEKIGVALESAGVIRSKIFFVWIAYLGGLHNKLSAGKFIFEEPQSTFRVLAQMMRERKELAVVIPEGATLHDIRFIFTTAGIQLPVRFDEATTSPKTLEGVIPKGKSKEGFLFPDTYRFYDVAMPADIVDAMMRNFSRKIEPLRERIDASGKSLYDIVTMASILEEEAKTKEDKKIVARILWKRISIGMPLQTDATLFYELGRASKDLTLNDLQNPTPYNTYQYKGLPPTPISNPGFDSLEAALELPTTNYLYYLTGSDGTMHYARTFEEHKKNKALYLK